MGYLLIAVVIGLIPASIAQSKGKSFALWWFYGAMLWIVALPHAIMLKADAGDEAGAASGGLKKKCPWCAEMIQRDAIICRYCGRSTSNPQLSEDTSNLKPLVPSETIRRRASNRDIVYVSAPDESKASSRLPWIAAAAVAVLIIGIGFSTDPSLSQRARSYLGIADQPNAAETPSESGIPSAPPAGQASVDPKRGAQTQSRDGKPRRDRIGVPDIDLTIGDRGDVAGREVRSAQASQAVSDDQTYYEFQVEKPVAQIPGTGVPSYPATLRSSGVEGEVQAQFVVDANGKADLTTFRVLRSTNPLFEEAVRSSLSAMRFYAAEIGGAKVRQLVQQSFQFKLDR